MNRETELINQVEEHRRLMTWVVGDRRAGGGDAEVGWLVDLPLVSSRRTASVNHPIMKRNESD